MFTTRNVALNTNISRTNILQSGHVFHTCRHTAREKLDLRVDDSIVPQYVFYVRIVSEWEKRKLPSSENRVVVGSAFRVTSVLVSHLAYTSCRRVDNTSTILLGLQL